jgi:hypothetical protein
MMMRRQRNISSTGTSSSTALLLWGDSRRVMWRASATWHAQQRVTFWVSGFAAL